MSAAAGPQWIAPRDLERWQVSASLLATQPDKQMSRAYAEIGGVVRCRLSDVEAYEGAHTVVSRQMDAGTKKPSGAGGAALRAMTKNPSVSKEN